MLKLIYIKEQFFDNIQISLDIIIILFNIKTAISQIKRNTP